MPPQQAIPPTDDPPRTLLGGIASYVVNLFVRLVISTESEGQVKVESAVSVTLQLPPGGDSGAARAPQVRHDPNITGNPPGQQAELHEAGLSRRPYEVASPEFIPDTWSEADDDDPPPMDVVPARGQPKRVSYLNTTFAETSGWPTDIGGHPLPTPPATPVEQVPAPGAGSPPSPSAAARAPARRAVERTDPGGLPLPILEPPRTPAKKAKAQDARAAASPSPGPSSPARAPTSSTLEHPGRLPPPTLELPRTLVKKQGKARDVRVAVSLCPGPSPSPRTPLHSKPTPSPGPSSPAPSSPVSTPRKKSRYSDAVPPPRSPAGPLALALREEGPAETPVEDPSLAVLEMLFSWQRKDLERILRRERDALQAEREHAWVGTLVKWDTGMGKTILTIALICVTLSELNMPTLILCPNVGMMTQWHEEIKKFAPHLKAAFYHASDTSGHLEKREALESYDVVLSTYHQVNEQARAKETSKIKKEQCDPTSYESHIFRSPTGKFAASCLALPKRVGLLLSATPMQNYPCDLYAQLHFLGRDYGELQKAREFTYRFAERRYLPTHVYNTAGTPLVDILRDACLYRPKISSSGRQWVGLPARTDRDTCVVRISEDERTLYRYIPDVLGRNEPFAVMIRLRQACLEPRLLLAALEPDAEEKDIHDDPEVVMASQSFTRRVPASSDAPMSAQLRAGDGLPRQIRHLAHLFADEYVSTRIRKARDILCEIASRSLDEKTIVYSCFKGPLHTLSRILRGENVGCRMYTGDFTAGERSAVLHHVAKDRQCKVLLMTIQSGGTGLNITSCNNVIVLDPWWNPYLEEQAIGRVHRIVQTKPVHVYRIVAEDTMETDKMVPLQDKKRVNIEELFQAIETE